MFHFTFYNTVFTDGNHLYQSKGFEKKRLFIVRAKNRFPVQIFEHIFKDSCSHFFEVTKTHSVSDVISQKSREVIKNTSVFIA